MRTNAASRKTGEEKGSGLFEEKENKWVVAGGSRGRGCCSSAPQRRAEGFRILFFFFRASLLAAKKELLPLWIMLLNCPREVCGRLLARCTGLSISLPCMCVTFTPLHT